MIKNLENKMEKMQKSINKDLEELKNEHTKTNITITEIKKKNKFESVLMRWMKLEPIIQSEVSQKEKHQYCILTHIYGI